jgi:hypothetical protein
LHSIALCRDAAGRCLDSVQHADGVRVVDQSATGRTKSLAWMKQLEQFRFSAIAAKKEAEVRAMVSGGLAELVYRYISGKIAANAPTESVAVQSGPPVITDASGAS